MEKFPFPIARNLQDSVEDDPDFHVVEFHVGVAGCIEWLGDELVLRCHNQGIRCRRVHRSDRSRVWIGFFDAGIAEQFRSAASRFGQ